MTFSWENGTQIWMAYKKSCLFVSCYYGGWCDRPCHMAVSHCVASDWCTVMPRKEGKCVMCRLWSWQCPISNRVGGLWTSLFSCGCSFGHSDWTVYAWVVNQSIFTWLWCWHNDKSCRHTAYYLKVILSIIFFFSIICIQNCYFCLASSSLLQSWGMFTREATGSVTCCIAVRQ